MSQERCYDCGRLLAEDEIRRVTIVTGRGYVAGQNTGHQGYISGSSTAMTKVTCCPACEGKRAEEDKKALARGDPFVSAIWALFCILCAGGAIWMAALFAGLIK